ncbi:NAD-dependent protein deacylase SRT2-like protein [Drosera capensis]
MRLPLRRPFDAITITKADPNYALTTSPIPGDFKSLSALAMFLSSSSSTLSRFSLIRSPMARTLLSLFHRIRRHMLHPDEEGLERGSLCWCSRESNYVEVQGTVWKSIPNGAYSTGFRPITHQEFIRSSKARRRYWSRSYAGWRRFTAAQPGPGHFALASLEKAGRISFMVTQNVDRLHHRAGSSPHELHGTVYIIQCIKCGYSFSRHSFQDQLKALNPKVACSFKTLFLHFSTMLSLQLHFALRSSIRQFENR